MDDILLNKHTRSRVQEYINDPAPVVILVGSPGAGKKYLAQKVAETIFDDNIARLLNQAKVQIVEVAEDKSAIGIGEIRQIARGNSTKSSAPGMVGKITIIYDAEKLSKDSQNALLKTLEEPNSKNKFIMSTSKPSQILPTVRSRSSLLYVKPPSHMESLAYFKDFDEQDVTSAWRLSDGAAAIMTSLLNDQDLPIKRAVEDAKAYLRMDGYQRLIFIDNLAKDRANLLNFTDGLAKVLKAAQHSSTARSDPKLATRLIKSRNQIMKVKLEINANSSTKLVGLKLASNLSV